MSTMPGSCGCADSEDYAGVDAVVEEKLGCWLRPSLLVSIALSTSVPDPLDSLVDVAGTALTENPAVSTVAPIMMCSSRKVKFFRTLLVRSVIWKSLPKLLDDSSELAVPGALRLEPAFDILP